MTPDGGAIGVWRGVVSTTDHVGEGPEAGGGALDVEAISWVADSDAHHRRHVARQRGELADGGADRADRGDDALGLALDVRDLTGDRLGGAGGPLASALTSAAMAKLLAGLPCAASMVAR